MIRPAIFADEFFETRTHPRLHLRYVGCSVRDGGLFDKLGNLLQRNRRLRRVDDGFELSF